MSHYTSNNSSSNISKFVLFALSIGLMAVLLLPNAGLAQPTTSPPGGNIDAQFDTVTVGPSLFDFLIRTGGGSNTEVSTGGNLLFNLRSGAGTLFFQNNVGSSTLSLNSSGIWDAQNNLLLADSVDITGRTEVQANIDASGTQGSGSLEIANALRLDGNEIITNANSALYLQHDNNGDLYVDNGTLFVDASANSVNVNGHATAANGFGTYTTAFSTGDVAPGASFYRAAYCPSGYEAISCGMISGMPAYQNPDVYASTMSPYGTYCQARGRNASAYTYNVQIYVRCYDSSV
ncbi:MAG TPA: hypothetical protein PKA32_03355 [Candidatus Gracilibacteria bacterium]|nr:hypothetical protein [Candidatus Gracilibacteria bacterium]